MEQQLFCEILTPDAVGVLLSWYRQAKRPLPWRETCDPYCIWLSEIMLQQTRVEAVKPYYARFLAACPTVASLAAIPEEQLLKLWEGLGYYSRARNLQKAAKRVMELHGGVMPSTYEELLALPGIGEYTAGAIASIAYDIRVPAVDGNVLRVLSRLGAVREDITDQKVKNAFREALIPCVPADAGDFTQALIELGAMVCVPNGAPKCEACPMRAVCRAEKDGSTVELPVKSPKKARRVEKKTVLLVFDGEKRAITKRPPEGLLAGLFQFPNAEGHLDAEAVEALLCSMGLEVQSVTRAPDAVHIFTHIEWHMIAYDVRVAALSPVKDWIPATDHDLTTKYAIPSAFSAYTKYLKRSENP